jgi:hypothetical protein
LISLGTCIFILNPSLTQNTVLRLGCCLLIISLYIAIHSTSGNLTQDSSLHRIFIMIICPKCNLLLSGAPVRPNQLCRINSEPLYQYHANESAIQDHALILRGLPLLIASDWSSHILLCTTHVHGELESKNGVNLISKSRNAWWLNPQNVMRALSFFETKRGSNRDA